MGKTNANYQRAYRESVRSDPEKNAKYLADKAAAQQVRRANKIAAMSETELEQRRQHEKEGKRKERELKRTPQGKLTTGAPCQGNESISHNL